MIHILLIIYLVGAAITLAWMLPEVLGVVKDRLDGYEVSWEPVLLYITFGLIASSWWPVVWIWMVRGWLQSRGQDKEEI